MMRMLMLVLGLVLMVAAGLWFFTPVLDPVWSKHVGPQIRQAQKRMEGPPPSSTRDRGFEAAKPSPQASIPIPANKFGLDSMFNVINLIAALAGAYFTFQSYRLQLRSRRSDRSSGART